MEGFTICGIVGFIGVSKYPQVSYNLITKLLEKSEIRGTDASGFWTTQKDGGVLYHKEPTKSSEFVKNSMWERLQGYELDAMIAHARGASKGVGSPSENKNNHPFVSTCKSVGMVHNGRIWDTEYNLLKQKYEVNSDCDSEILLRIFESQVFGENKEINPEELFDEQPPIESKEFLTRLCALKDIWTLAGSKGHIASAISERVDEKTRVLWLFRNKHRPLWLIDLRNHLGQIFFCSTPEIWQEAASECRDIKSILMRNRIKLIELPPEEIWMMRIGKDSPTVKNDSLLRIEVNTTGKYSRWEPGEKVKISQRSSSFDIVTGLNEDDSVILTKNTKSDENTENTDEGKWVFWQVDYGTTYRHFNTESEADGFVQQNSFKIKRKVVLETEDEIVNFVAKTKGVFNHRGTLNKEVDQLLVIKGYVLIEVFICDTVANARSVLCYQPGGIIVHKSKKEQKLRWNVFDHNKNFLGSHDSKEEVELANNPIGSIVEKTDVTSQPNVVVESYIVGVETDAINQQSVVVESNASNSENITDNSSTAINCTESVSTFNVEQHSKEIWRVLTPDRSIMLKEFDSETEARDYLLRQGRGVVEVVYGGNNARWKVSDENGKFVGFYSSKKEAEAAAHCWDGIVKCIEDKDNSEFDEFDVCEEDNVTSLGLETGDIVELAYQEIQVCFNVLKSLVDDVSELIGRKYKDGNLTNQEIGDLQTDLEQMLGDLRSMFFVLGGES